jgi:hypothetical protein
MNLRAATEQYGQVPNSVFYQYRSDIVVVSPTLEDYSADFDSAQEHDNIIRLIKGSPFLMLKDVVRDCPPDLKVSRYNLLVSSFMSPDGKEIIVKKSDSDMLLYGSFRPIYCEVKTRKNVSDAETKGKLQMAVVAPFIAEYLGEPIEALLWAEDVREVRSNIKTFWPIGFKKVLDNRGAPVLKNPFKNLLFKN